MLNICRINKCQYLAPKICKGFHFKLEHISILLCGILQPVPPAASLASFCCSLIDYLIKFPLPPLPLSNPPFQAWVLLPPGSFLVPTVQVFLELLLSITHFVLNLPQLLSRLISPSGNMQWPWRQALFFLSFCALSPPQPLIRVSLPPAPSQEPFLLVMFSQKAHPHSVYLRVPELHHASFTVLTFQFPINYSAAHFQPKSSLLQCPFSSSHHLRAAFTSNDMITSCALPDIKAT